MHTVQAYQGYFQDDGQFITLEESPVEIPKHVEVYIVFTGKPVKHDNTIQSKRAIAIDTLKGVIPQGFDFDLDEIRHERLKARGLL